MIRLKVDTTDTDKNDSAALCAAGVSLRKHFDVGTSLTVIQVDPMPNQPEIIRPRIRRSGGRSGNAPGTLAEQSTRVLIRVPLVTASSLPLRKPPSEAPRKPPADLPRQSPANLPSIKPPPAISDDAIVNYTTPAPSLGSGLPGSNAAAPGPSKFAATTPAIDRHLTTRIDAAHAATVSPHLAAPDWLDDRPGLLTKFVREQLPLLVALVAGIVLGAVVLHGRAHSTAIQENGASRIHSATQESPDQPQAAAKVTQTTAVKFNDSAKISSAAAKSPTAGGSAGSIWEWNPKAADNSPAAANSPASISQPADPPSAGDTANTPAIVAPAGVAPNSPEANDPSRAAWLQGTITSPSEPIQR